MPASALGLAFLYFKTGFSYLLKLCNIESLVKLIRHYAQCSVKLNRQPRQTVKPILT